MFRRVATLLTILSFAIVTAMSAAHAASIATGDMVAAHGEHMTSSAADDADCGPSAGCGHADTEKCAAACAGLLSCLAPPLAEGVVGHFAITHGLPAQTAIAGRAPALAERPPILRLL